MPINISFSDKTVRVAVELNGGIESAVTYLPERPWVGLTEQERDTLIAGGYDRDTIVMVEGLLKGNNT